MFGFGFWLNSLCVSARVFVMLNTFILEKVTKCKSSLIYAKVEVICYLHEPVLISVDSV